MTKEKKLDQIIDDLDLLEMKRQEIEQLQLDMSENLISFKEEYPDFAMEISTKTPYNGRYYSIRTRKSSLGEIAYICVCDEPFGSWRKKKKCPENI